MEEIAPVLIAKTEDIGEHTHSFQLRRTLLRLPGPHPVTVQQGSEW